MKPLAPSTRQNIISSLHNGKSIRQISKEQHVSHGVVGILCQNLSDLEKSAKGGRPATLTPQSKRNARRLIKTGQCQSAPQVAKELSKVEDKNVNPWTVRRALKIEGMKAIKIKKKPLLRAKHRNARLKWAQKHLEWTLEDWKKVIWSDETKINRIGNDGPGMKWIDTTETGLEKHNVTGTVKFGGGNIMVWGCMTYYGVGHCQLVEGKMNAMQYVEILENSLEKSLGLYDLERQDIIFQQDNDPKHTSKTASEWFRSSKIETITWPAQSPDLNPIEHLWGHLKRALEKYETDAKSREELTTRTMDVWKAISPETCRNLIESMPRRCAAVVKARGGATKY